MIVRRPRARDPRPLAALALAVALILPATARIRAGAAQVPTVAPAIGLAGTISDLATGGVLGGVRVAAGLAATRSDVFGRYQLSLPAGQYAVRVEAPGYSGATVTGVRVGDSPGTLDVGLPPLDPPPDGARAIVARLTGTAATEPESPNPSELGPSALAATVTEVPRVIRVLMPDGTIVAMDTDEYLKGVVPHEMGYVFRRGLEALKAQAVASRTYAAAHCLAGSAGDPARCEPGLDANVDTTTHTQVWGPVHYDVSDEAVEATHGQVARDGDALITAMFFARTVDRTLDSELSPCCGGTRTRYLRGVSSPEAFRARLGHGAGMSQEGAATFAAWGATVEEIIQHYYTGVRMDPPGRLRLYDAGVSPRQGTTTDVFTFTVGYADPDGDPPVTHEVLLDGTPHPMTGPTAPDHDFRLGATYVFTSTLPAGDHGVDFRFDDGYTAPVTLDAGTVTVLLGRAGRQSAGTTAAEVTPASGTQAGSTAYDAADFTAPPSANVDRTADGVAPSARRMVTLDAPARPADFPFMALAAQWTGAVLDGAVQLEVRTSRDNTVWSEWRELPDDEEDAKAPAPAGEHWTRLLVARGRYVQTRAILQSGADSAPRLNSVTVHYFNSDVGPAAPAAAAQAGEPTLIHRAAWGADEHLRFDSSGAEIWPVEYTKPLAQIVHHTVTTNDPADPAAVVRSVYYYHAVTRGWGDIGYNFLIDDRGNIYEGRYGGERNGTIVQGGHALQYNPNTIGAALLGTFTDVRPSTAAESALVSLLAAKGVRYGIQPMAPVTLLGNQFAHCVMGHRDVLPGHTVCPGDAAYDRLGAIRLAVAGRMAELENNPPTPTPRPTATSRPAAPTASPMPPTALPADCGDSVMNGGFEVEDTSWVKNRASYTGYDVYHGTKSMFVGLRDSDPDTEQTYASVAQSVRLPARVGTVHLTFAAKTHGQDVDRRLVRLMDANGAIIGLGSFTLPANSDWTPIDLDVSAALAGRGGSEVRVYFAVVNNGDGQRSYLRLDDVALVVCPDVSATSPSATARPATATTVATATAITLPSTPHPTATPVASPTAICADLLTDGSFETVDLAAWRRTGEHPVQRVGTPVDSGTGALVLGLSAPGSDAFGYAAAAQDVVLPADTYSATLSLALDPLNLAPGDAVVLELRRTTDGTRRTLLGPNLADTPGQWTRHSFPVDPAALGPEVQVYLAVLNRGQSGSFGAVTAIAVDDVHLDACYRPRGAHQAYLPSALSTGP